MTHAAELYTESELESAVRAAVRAERARAARSHTATFAADSEDSPQFRAALKPDEAPRYGRYFAADDAGHYPFSMHRHFGMGWREFADAANLVRKQITDKNGRTAWHWVKRAEDAAPKGAGAKSAAPASDAPKPPAEHEAAAKEAAAAVATEAVATLPEGARDNPGIRGKVADLALTAAAAVYAKLFQWQDRFDQIGGVLGAVFDTPSDMQKLGYNPGASSGTATGAGGLDPVRANLVEELGTGVSGHLFAKIAATTITKALFWLKGKAQGEPAQMAAGGDPRELLAEFLADLFDAAHGAVGLAPVDRAAVGAAVAKLLTRPAPATFSAPALGPVEFRKPAELIADPDRFQYRPKADGDDGTVRELPEEEFDRAKCKPLVGWRDPADGREFVVDGHHRRAWAERDGADEVPVRFLDAPTAEAARAYGRRLNEALALAATFSAPGAPPRPGLVWNEGTHRWRNPETNEEHDHAPATGGAPPAASSPPAADGAAGGDVWRKKLPPVESVTARPKTKKARDELAKAVQSAWTEARNALVAKYGTRDINDRMSPEEVEAENRVFAALRPLASGNERDGPHDLGPISDARYQGYYRGAVQALDALRGAGAPAPAPAPAASAPEPAPGPAPDPASKPPKPAKIPAAPDTDALAKKPLGDKRLLKRFIDSAPTPKAKELLEDAEWNMGPETVADRWGADQAGTAVRRHTVDQLGAVWRVAHEQGLTAEAAYLAAVLDHYGARVDDAGVGARVPFDPTRYASAGPVSTGATVTVTRPALVLPERTGEYVVEKGAVAP